MTLDNLWKKPGVYFISHLASGRRYVGSSVDIGNRWCDHISRLKKGKHHSRHMQRTWDKYGEDQFQFGVLMLCEPFELLRYEQWFMDKWNPEFNSSPVAGSPLGRKVSEVTRARMGKHRIGKKHSIETRKKIGDANRGKIKPVFSPEHCAKISAVKTGKPLSPYHCARISEGQRGKKRSPLSEQHRANLSVSGKGKKRSAEARHNISAGLKGHSISPETRAKIAESLRRRHRLLIEKDSTGAL